MKIKYEKITKENSVLKNQILQMKDAKNLINEKFQELNKKNDIIKSNLQILNQRELEVNSRENEVKTLINNYKFLLNSRFYQLNVSSSDRESNYTYFFEPLDNIVSLKIVSISLPTPRLNIDSNSNLLLLTIDNENVDIRINKGYYSINRLIEILNNECKDYNLEFSLNENQKLCLSKIEDDSKIITLTSNNLSDKILGFGSEEVYLDLEYNSIDALKTWDLRLHDKLYLHINNLQTDPLCLLYFNGKCDSSISFQEPISLNQFDIEIKDQNGNLYDFNNLDHSINIQLEVLNEIFLENDNNNENEIDLSSMVDSSHYNFESNFGDYENDYQ